jgi:hypothetical protein
LNDKKDNYVKEIQKLKEENEKIAMKINNENNVEILRGLCVIDVLIQMVFKILKINFNLLKL